MWWQSTMIGLRSSKALPQAKPVPKKKVMVTVWWSAAHLIHYSFLNPGEAIASEKYVQQINEIHWKLQCLQPALVNRKSPILFHENIQLHIAQSMLEKLKELVYKVLPHPPYSLDLSPMDYHFFKHLDSFLQGKGLHKQLEVDSAFQEFNPKAWIFMLQE